MNVIQRLLPHKMITGAQLLAYGRPRCLKLVRGVLRGRQGIEIGGPSAVFRRWYNLPVYDVVGGLSNCDFSQQTEWANHSPAYHFSKNNAPGKTYFCEGSELAPIADATFDFLLSSHNLEHFANPFRGLREWQRVVVPGGYLVLILPHFAKTFDHRRMPTTVEHMLQDYRNNVQEDDLTHVEEVFVAHRLNESSRSDEELRHLLLSNFSHRMMHHHVFDEVNGRAMLEAAGFEVLAVETAPPFHIILLARFPLTSGTRLL